MQSLYGMGLGLFLFFKRVHIQPLEVVGKGNNKLVQNSTQEDTNCTANFTLAKFQNVQDSDDIL